MSLHALISEMRERAALQPYNDMASMAIRWADELESALAGGGEAVAWMAEDKRVIPAESKATGERCGGATKMATDAYTIPLFNHPMQLTDGVALIAAERQRQIAAEGWTPEHDDEHAGGQLADAAACYALQASQMPYELWFNLWPWDLRWWKPSDRVRDLVKAGALIAAEIERLQRNALNPGGSP